MGKSVTPKYEEAKQGDLKRMVLSYDKAKKILGFSPKYGLEDGIRKYVNWYSSIEH